MTEPQQRNGDRHNPESWKPNSVEFDSLGAGTIRNHIAIAHGELWDARAMHIPVGREGVVP